MSRRRKGWAAPGGDADPENSEFASSAFVLERGRARIRAELWVLSQECPLGAGIGMATEQFSS